MQQGHTEGAGVTFMSSSVRVQVSMQAIHVEGGNILEPLAGAAAGAGASGAGAAGPGAWQPGARVPL